MFPVPDALRALVRPSETQVSTGSHVAPQRGDGIEFADLRPFLPGDRPRSINWRATARRGDLMVNQRHPERATDVVLFLDSFLDVRGPTGSTLDQAVGAAASLAAAYLRQRDRVGLVSFGGFVQWLQPGSGQAALYRLLDTLMETQVFATAAWKGIRHLPPRTLPAKALIVALTPLVDERGVAALFDLLARGYDLAVVDISPLTHAGPAAGEWGELARRLWALERETLRHRYQRLGAAVVEWTRRDAPAAGAPGGGGMPAPRRARTRLACGLAATAVAAVLALAPLAAVSGRLRDALAWLAGIGLVLAAAAALRAPRCSPRPWSCSSPSTRSSWSAGATASTPPPPWSGPACSCTPSWPAGPGRPAPGSVTSAPSSPPARSWSRPAPWPPSPSASWSCSPPPSPPAAA